MRILLISWQFPPYVVGGMGKHVAELAPALSELNCNGEPFYVDVVTTRSAGGLHQEKLNDYVTVYRVDITLIDPLDLYNSIMAGSTAIIQQARILARQHTYDLIHVHDWSAGSAGITLKHEWKVPLLATIHATERGRHQGYLPSDTSRQINQVEWQICYEAWRVIVCSEYMCNEAQSYFGVPRDKLDIVANGIDFDALYQSPPEVVHKLQEQYAPNGERLLFFVGRITHEKGLHVLIHAMPQILADYPDVRLLAAGKNSEKMLPLAKSLGIEQSTTFFGYISDQERDYFYQAVDAAIFPSLYEPFGIVALEAMALGCNVVSTDVGGLGEVVQHEQNGLTVYPDDSASIAWAVNQVFTKPDAAKKRREFARQQVYDLYNWPEIAGQTSKIYKRVVQERNQTVW